jgi:hypothetical protein
MRLTSISDLTIPGISMLEQEVWKLSKLYDEYLDTVDEPARTPGIHASELNTCKRQVVFSLLDTTRKADVEAKWRKKFDVGTAIHTMVQDHFTHMAQRSRGRLTFEREVRVDDTDLARRLFLTSSCDGIFTFFDEQGDPLIRVALEAKTAAPDDYEKLKEPHKKHLEQAHLYMACLDVPLTWFLYWNKGKEQFTPSITPFLTRFDPAIWARLEQRAQECLTYAEKAQLPASEEDYMHCSFCAYAYICQPKVLEKRASRFTTRLPILGGRRL